VFNPGLRESDDTVLSEIEAAAMYIFAARCKELSQELGYHSAMFLYFLFVSVRIGYAVA
jgi:hypothetical protein